MLTRPPLGLGFAICTCVREVCGGLGMCSCFIILLNMTFPACQHNQSAKVCSGRLIMMNSICLITEPRMACSSVVHNAYVMTLPGASCRGSHLGPGERLDVQVVWLALRALVGDLDDDGAVDWVRLAATAQVPKLHECEWKVQTKSQRNPWRHCREVQNEQLRLVHVALRHLRAQHAIHVLACGAGQVAAR